VLLMLASRAIAKRCVSMVAAVRPSWERWSHRGSFLRASLGVAREGGTWVIHEKEKSIVLRERKSKQYENVTPQRFRSSNAG